MVVQDNDGYEHSEGPTDIPTRIPSHGDPGVLSNGSVTLSIPAESGEDDSTETPDQDRNCTTTAEGDNVKAADSVKCNGGRDLELRVPELNSKHAVISNVENGNSCETVDFERAIELTGYGKFHYFLLIVCGFVSTSEEMDVISMSFILPSAQCDLELNTHTKGWLNSIIFIGMMAGAYLWGQYW
uniref:Synaptic vesicle glycoprotein 2B n=1 Tax=Cacopsylla melanoneura TaxID=428564 RepID=A0A8D8ZZ21_9HEMI